MQLTDADAALPPFYDDLDASLRHAWDLLEQGVKARRSAFHTPSLATVGMDGLPDVRTVVLRQADRARALLRFHTDRRSGKWEQLSRNDRCAVHIYDAAMKIQLRLRGTAALHHGDAVATAAWEGSRPLSRQCYAQPAAPGAALDRPLAGGDAQGPTDGAENFCVLLFTVDRVEWLYLSHRGHRRAAWSRTANGWNGGWLAP